MKALNLNFWKTLLITALFLLPAVFAWCTPAASYHEKEPATETTSATGDNSPCANLAAFLEKEFFPVTKPLSPNSTVRIYGTQENDAMKRLLAVCARLKAKIWGEEEGKTVFILPDGTGKILVDDNAGEDEFLRMVIVSGCDLPVTEVRFVSLDHYNRHRP
ncbi:MAG: hypothetical protein LUF87_01785 [Alistipes sp.]|nr:hypothetical protein [Alistipes sp.]